MRWCHGGIAKTALTAQKSIAATLAQNDARNTRLLSEVNAYAQENVTAQTLT